MANRTLARANDAHPEILEDGEPHNVGMWEEVTIERSSAGAPGLLFIITRYENSMEFDQMCVTVPDGLAFLAPVNAWLRGTPDAEYWRAAHRLNEHFAAHMAVARADQNEDQYRGAHSLLRDLRVLTGQEA